MSSTLPPAAAGTDSDSHSLDENRPERSLDPENWNAMRDLGARMLDDLFTFLSTIRERPVWQPPTTEARDAYREPLPLHGTSPDAIYDEYKRHILPHLIGNAHPRFWGWVTGNGTVMGMLADMLASGTNAHAAFGDQAATHVERQVIGWFT